MERKMREKNVIYYVIMVLVLAAMLLIPHKNAFAAGASVKTAPVMKVGSKVSGVMKQNKHYYKFSVSSNSVIYFDLRTGSSSQKAAFSILNSKGNKIDESSYYETSKTSGLSFQHCRRYLALNAGTYYIELGSASCYYTLQTTRTASTSSTTKIAGYSNKSLSSALSVSLGNKIYSAAYGSKICHYYRFSVNTKTPVRFVTEALTSGNGVTCYLYSSSGRKLATIADKATSSVRKVYTATLSAGIYYIGVYDLNYSGRYTISTTKMTSSKKTQVISASNVKAILGVSPFSLKAKLTQGNGTLSYTSSNKSVVTVSKAGKVTVRGVGTATITITASETSSYQKTVKKVTVKVYPKSTTITSLVCKESRKMTVRWNMISGSTGYHVQFATNSDFSSPKAYYASSGASGVTFSRLQSGKRYYVRVRSCKKVGNVTYYSSWSSVKSVVTW